MKSSDFNVFSINILCIYGSETIIKVLPTCFEYDSISTLKKLIENQTGFSYDKQCIVFNERLVSDEQILKDIGVEYGSTIHMVYKGNKRKSRIYSLNCRELNSRYETITTVEIDLNTSTVLDLKNILAKKFGCMDEVKIILGGEKLKDDVLLDDIKITYYPHFNYKLPWR